MLSNLELLLDKSKSRLAWDNYFMGLAIWAKQRSVCKRLKVGCVIVKDKRVICMGYNGFLPGAPHTSIIKNDHELATVHAEQNAISDAAARGVCVKNASAYITHYPCINCFKTLVSAHIKKIYYHSDYHNNMVVEFLAEQNYIELIKL